jgi:hypothetical protein
MSNDTISISSDLEDTITLTSGSYNMSTSFPPLTTSLGNLTTTWGATGAPLTTVGPSLQGGYTISTPNTIGHGQVLTTNGTSGLSWGTISIANDLKGSSLSVKGDADFEGDIKVKGKSILETLEKIEEKLAIFKPNPELEERWDQLRELAKQYKDLEKELIEKEKMWDILKR